MENKQNEKNLENEGILLKSILKSLTEKCTLEANAKKLSIGLNDPKERVVFYSGLKIALVNKLLLDKPKTSMLDLQSRILILETVKNVYLQNRMPNFSTIFEEATKVGQIKTVDDKLVLGLNVFLEEMEVLDFLWKETIKNNGAVGTLVMEDPEVRFERYMYLNKLKNFRNNSVQKPQIVYVDERLVDDTLKYQKPWLAGPLPKSSNVVHETVFYHAVSKKGFITGMFSNQDSAADFTKWLMDILMMRLEGPSVIIMDNNPAHGCLEYTSSITRYHTKADMLKWLTSNNIPCCSDMSKPALFELIKKCNENQKENKIDRIIRSQGHEVLRLPRHFYDLSMTTPLWDYVTKNSSVNITTTLMHLQNQTMKIINNIPLPNWAEFEQSIEKIETEIFNIDMAMDKLIDKYEIKLV